ncbi:putative RNA-directed DNA polymerase from transposon X-element [Trichonephila clavipes]|nr:putative RNA-directed DNA polymerase from transposon X-element [Trichonephila clavipes]
MQPFPKHPIPLESCANHGGTLPANKPKRNKGGRGVFSGRYPTTDNLIAFKRAKALARRIRRQCQRESWIQYVSSITSSTTSQQLWRKVKAANGLYRDFNIPILETSTALYSSPLDVANLIGKTFASVSSSDSYSPAFQATKNRLERTPINFRCRQPLPYNCDFDMFELKREPYHRPTILVQVLMEYPMYCFAI